MAGPIVRIIVQLGIQFVGVFARAFGAAYQQALQNARKAGVTGTTVKAMKREKITVDESLKILNLDRSQMRRSTVEEQFKRYFEANDPKNGGSFYLQSKLYRARERVLKELDEMEAAKNSASSSSSSSSQKPE